MLSELIKFTDTLGYTHPKFIEIARRINPDLNPDDHLLIFQYQNTKDPIKKEIILKTIYRRLCLIQEEIINKYDGFSDINNSALNKRLKSLMYALESVIENSDEFFKLTLKYGFFMDIIKKNEEYISALVYNPKYSSKIKIIELISLSIKYYKENNSIQYLKTLHEIRSNKEMLLNLLTDIQSDFLRSQIGSQSKIHNYKLFYAINFIANIALIGNKNHVVDIDQVSFSNYNRIISTPEKVDDILITDEIKNRIKDTAKKARELRIIFENKPSIENQTKLLSCERVLMTYLNYCGRLNISYKEIEPILREEKIFDSPKQHSNLKLKKVIQKGAVSISPKDLPKGIIDILKEIGVFEDICKDINIINLTKHNLGKAIRGLTTGFGSIWINIPDQNYPDWLLANVIIHEWLHVKWRKDNFNNPELLRSIPNERNSWLGTSENMKVYLSSLISKYSPEIKEYNRLIIEYTITLDITLLPIIYDLQESVINKIHDISFLITSQQLTGTLANKYLKYPLDELSQRFDLPANSDELDFDSNYITQLIPDHSERLKKIVKSLNIKNDPEIKDSIYKLLYLILTGNGYIQDNIYHDKSGNTIKLSDLLDEKELDKFLYKFLLLFPKYYYSFDNAPNKPSAIKPKITKESVLQLITSTENNTVLKECGWPVDII